MILGLCLMAVTAVSWADGGGPVPTPGAPPAVEATPTPDPLTAAPPAPIPEPPTATATVTATVTPAVTPTPSAAPAAAASTTPTASVVPLRARAPRAGPQATPAPSVTPAAPSQSHGAALTLCHYTGDDTRPYVAVTIPAGEYSPHFDDELDIIPAPAAGCDDVGDPDLAAAGPVTVCHATGDPAHPYVLLRYPNGDLGGHEDDAGDLIPAPQGTCPGLAAGGYAVPTTTATPIPTQSAEATATAAPTAHALTPVDVLSDEPAATPTASPPAAAVSERGGSLPFTGLYLGLLFAIGSGCVMAGSGLRLLSQPAIRR